MAYPDLEHRAFTLREPWHVRPTADGHLDAVGPGGVQVRFALQTTPAPCLKGPLTDGLAPDTAVNASIAVLEAVLVREPARDHIHFDSNGDARLRQTLRAMGVVVTDLDQGDIVRAAMLWQRPEPWLPADKSVGAFPFVPQMTQGRRHPQRAPKPTGTVYARHIPWLGQTLSFEVADPDRHLDRFHKWMNDPRVAAFFEEEGDLAYHRDYLENLTADPGMLPLIGCFDGAPFAYFEIYWAKESRLGPYYDADDYDRGWHVLVGEDAYRGKEYLAAWLPSLTHFMLLDEPRTHRIVGEPAATHHQQIRNLQRSGFAHVKTFFPSRTEFNDYLRWVAGHFDDACAYDQRVVNVEPMIENGAVTRLRVTSESRDGRRTVCHARNLVAASGGQPAIPKGFETTRHDERVIHSSAYLGAVRRMALNQGPPRRIAVVGGGQSAAEIFMDLAERFPESRNDLDGLLGNLRDWVVDTTVDRHYRLRTTTDFHPTVFCQGGNEASHGLSDTLLSVLPTRSMEIVEALLADMAARDDADASAARPCLSAATGL